MRPSAAVLLALATSTISCAPPTPSSPSPAASDLDAHSSTTQQTAPPTRELPAPSLAPLAIQPPEPDPLPANDEKPCKGFFTQESVETISALAAQSKHCYNELLRRDPKAEGKVTVQVRVEADGTVRTRPLVVSDTLEDPVAVGCVLDTFADGIPSAPPQGGCAIAQIPMNFQPKSKE